MKIFLNSEKEFLNYEKNIFSPYSERKYFHIFDERKAEK